MKKIVFLIIMAYGCSAMAVDPIPPTGEEVFKLLLSSGNIKLKNEPLCNVISISKIHDDMLLVNHLATVFSTTYDTDNINTVATSCSKSKHQKESGHVVDIWGCSLQVTESSQNGSFISSSMVAFGISKGKNKIVSGTLRCF